MECTCHRDAMHAQWAAIPTELISSRVNDHLASSNQAEVQQCSVRLLFPVSECLIKATTGHEVS